MEIYFSFKFIMKAELLVVYSLFFSIYSAFSQDCRFVREVKQREPALERSIRKWRWKERDSRQLHCYEMQYTGHGITSANLCDLSFLDSLIFRGDHRGHPCAVTYVEESGRLVVGMPRNYSEGRRGYLQLMEGYKRILEKGNGGFLFCLSRMHLPCWLYFVLDNEGNLYGIEVPLPPGKEVRILDHAELLSARDWDEENADMRESVNPYYPEFELDLSCYGEWELYDLLSARFGDRRVEIRCDSEEEWILLRAVWQASGKKDPGEGKLLLEACTPDGQRIRRFTYRKLKRRYEVFVRNN